MSENVELSPVKRALIDLRDLRARVAELEARAHEPMAIVGMSVRAPGGVTDLAGFERLLWSGTDAIADIPPDRWPVAEWFDEDQDAPGKMYLRQGGFLDDVASFDAEFFGIAPVEAASMDPQQRLVLELAWEAFEHAGRAPTSLAGSRTGVYLGIANGDYGRALFSHPEIIDPYFSPGNAYSVAAGRVAYVLGLHGPALAIDTACSSSLVALHLACQGLRHGDCDTALVAGVNLILTPELSVNFCKAGMMSRDGRCRTFDAAAGGYVRGEGGGAIVLRRLREAIAEGDRILAIVRGSAINQDGRSNGLTAPNGPAQTAVVRAALADGSVPPRVVGYIEAHGTGTSLGDPIEVGALAAVFAEGRDAASPLALGSVKTNIGHLEAAAGVMGVIKTVLALERREIPPHLHFGTPNPLIDWKALPLTVPTSTVRWPAIEDRHVAGVSSFGFSGTNAHVVLERAPDAESPDEELGRREQLLALSARDQPALRALGERYADVLTTGSREWTVREICATANTGRAHLSHRVAVAGSSIAELKDALGHWLRGAEDPRVVVGQRDATGQAPRVAFLFPGQGPQYAGMGRDLYDTSVVYRQAFDQCAGALEPLLGRALAPIVFPAADEDPSLIHQTAYAQPAMFAVEFALAALWRSWGVEPAAVMGHSFGEYAAACVAGVLSLGDAARVVVARGRLAARAPGDGLMVIVEASEDESAQAIRAVGGPVAIAAINGPSNTVISGERRAVEAVASSFSAIGRRTTPLRVSHAFHSPLMDPVLDAFERELAGVQYAPPTIAIISNLTGEAADLATIGRSRYWRDHLRQPVRFARSIRALADKGITHYVEMSPHPVLLGMGADCVTGATWLPSLRQEQGAWGEMLRSLQTLYVDGLTVNWDGVERGQAHRRVALPTYPFQRRRHWIDAVNRAPTPDAGASPAIWSTVARALDREAPRGPLDLNAASYPAKWDILARLTEAQVWHTLRDLGVFRTTGARETLDSLLSRAGIAGAHRRLVSRWLDRLAAAGILGRVGDAYEATGRPADRSLTELWADAARECADNPELFAYVRNCATHLPSIVTGRESALESLFPDGSFDLATALYERSATMRYINGLAAAAAEAAAHAVPTTSELRVLEIGAGTGGTTSAILRALPAGRTRYRFTDVSDAFLEAARTRFASFTNLEFGTFNLEIDPATQGYEDASFDVIISANAVHAVRDLPAALGRLRALLAPGGVLVLVESTAHLAYFDMTTGLIEGWQHFADPLRGDNPLLPPDAWVDALLAAGMSNARAWPDRGSLPEAMGQHVIVASAPGLMDTAHRRPLASGAGQTPGSTADVNVSRTGEPVTTTLTQRLRDAMPSERVAMLCDVVRTEVMRILRLDPASPPARHDRLMDLGMDSLMAVQLKNALNRAVELERGLPSTLMFDYPTIEAIATFLLDRVVPPEVSESRIGAGPRAARHDHSAPLAASAIAALSDDEIASLLLEREGEA